MDFALSDQMKNQLGFQNCNKQEVRTCESRHWNVNIQTGHLSCLPYMEFSCAFTEASAREMTNKRSARHNNIHVHWV